jgi:hypothetical protein
VVVIAACSEESGLISVSLHLIETEHVAIKCECAI